MTCFVLSCEICSSCAEAVFDEQEGNRHCPAGHSLDPVLDRPTSSFQNEDVDVRERASYDMATLSARYGDESVDLMDFRVPKNRGREQPTPSLSDMQGSMDIQRSASPPLEQSHLPTRWSDDTGLAAETGRCLQVQTASHPSL